MTDHNESDLIIFLKITSNYLRKKMNLCTFPVYSYSKPIYQLKKYITKIIFF